MQQNAGELQPVGGEQTEWTVNFLQCSPGILPFAGLWELKHHSHHIWLLKDFCELSL